MLIFLITSGFYLILIKVTVEGACIGCCVPDPDQKGSCFDECFVECIKIEKFSNCAQIQNSGVNKSGIYTLYIKDSNKSEHEVEAYCDMDTDGGGWTVFQNRHNGSVSFYQNWNTYKQGFGDLNGEFWWGNDNLAWALAHGSYTLRIDMTSFDGQAKYAQYEDFTLADESDNYRITLGIYTGTAGDSASSEANLASKFLMDGQQFSTYDRDNDIWTGNCVLSYGFGNKGPGWWFSACIATNLNGDYKSSGVNNWNGIVWYSFFTAPISLKETTMKFRPKDH